MIKNRTRMGKVSVAISYIRLTIFPLISCLSTEVFICEGKTGNISCSDKPDMTLDITYASYGRTSRDICVHPKYPKSRIDCPKQLDKTLSIVKELCQEKVTCELTAENDVFGDTCKRTYKYLEVQFECKLGKWWKSTVRPPSSSIPVPPRLRLHIW